MKSVWGIRLLALVGFVSIACGGNNVPPAVAPTVDAITAQTVDENKPMQPVQVMAHDPQQSPITYTLMNGPTGMTVSDSGLIEWTPDYDQAGMYTVTVVVTNSSQLTAMTDFLVTVNNVDRPPAFTDPGPQTAMAGMPYSLTVMAADPDQGDLVSIGFDVLPTGAFWDPSTNTLTWTPTFAQAGTHPITFTATTTNETPMLTASLTVYVNVSVGNRPPVLDFIGNKVVDEGMLLTFQVTGTDPDGDALTFDAAPLPANATFDPATGAFSFTPDFTQTGMYTILFTVTDAGGLTDTESVVIDVGGTNRNPVLSPIGPQTVAEGSPLALTLMATDPDGNAIAFSFSGTLPTGATFDPSTGLFQWTPGYDQAGTHGITFVATDDGMPPLSDSEFVNITVTNTNRPPVINAISSKMVDALSNLTFTATAFDPDGDTVVLSASGLPTGATFDPASGTFSWTPTLAQVGTFVVTFGASDGMLADSEMVTITVNPHNVPPVLTSPGAKTVAEGAALTFTLAGSDANGDTISYSYSPSLPGATLDPATGAFSWTPGYDQAGSHSVTFTATDDGSPPLSDSKTIVITVTNTNRPPVIAFIGNQTVAQGATLMFTVSASDPDGDPVTLTSSMLPMNATFNAISGVFSFSPSFSQTGTVNMTFTATDPASATGTQMVSIVINGTNQPPVLTAIPNQTIGEGSPLSISLSATDPDGNAITYGFSGSLPTGATFDVPTGHFQWTPNYGQAGTYNVTFTATDNGVPSLADSHTVTLTVTHTNRAPVFTPVGDQNVKATETLALTVTATDPDGDPLTYVATGLPAGATFNPATHTLSFTPTLAQVGSVFNIVFTATDTSGLAGNDSVQVTVLDKNIAPTLAAIASHTLNEGATVSFTLSATDPNPGQTLGYTFNTLPAGATFDGATGAFSWTPSYNQAGSYSITFTATDNGTPSLSDSKTALITVNNVNRAPVMPFVGNKTVAESGSLSFTVSANDPDGDTVTLSSTAIPMNATFTPANGLFTFNPTFGQAGTYNITFTATDNGAPILSSMQTVQIVVGSTNRPPVLATVGGQSGAEGSALTFTLSATDPDAGDVVTYSGTGLPPGASVNPATGVFSWTPNYGQAGNYSVTLIATDNGAPNLSDSESIVLSIAHTNRPPIIATIGDRTVTEGTALAFTVSATDPDGNAITLGTSGSLPAGATFSAATGQFQWTPNYAQSGSYSVTFTAQDNFAPPASSSQTVNITVNNKPLTTVTAVPNKGASTGGTTVVLTASGVEPGATVTINGVNAPVSSVDTAAGTITVTTPAQPGVFGFKSVTVTNPDTSSATNSSGFRYFLGSVAFNGVYQGTNYGSHNVGTADFNGDGFMDIWMTNSAQANWGCGWGSNNQIEVRYGDGTGNFPTNALLPTAYCKPGFAAAADFNNDGRPDLLVQGWSQSSFQVIFNDPGDVWTQGPTIGMPGDTRGTALVADFDKDGTLDVAMPDAGGSLFYFRGQGGGTAFDPAVVYATGIGRVDNAVLADVDNDTYQDIVMMPHSNTPNVAVMYGAPGGSFSTVVYASTMVNTNRAMSAQVGDTDGDGDLDIVTFGNNEISVLRNDSFRAFTAQIQPGVSIDTRQSAKGDFNQDGIPDFVDVSVCGTNVVRLLGMATINLTNPGGGCSRTGAVSDFNNDGKPDIVIGFRNGGGLKIMMNISQ